MNSPQPLIVVIHHARSFLTHKCPLEDVSNALRVAVSGRNMVLVSHLASSRSTTISPRPWNRAIYDIRHTVTNGVRLSLRRTETYNLHITRHHAMGYILVVCAYPPLNSETENRDPGLRNRSSQGWVISLTLPRALPGFCYPRISFWLFSTLHFDTCTHVLHLIGGALPGLRRPSQA